jgi:hypothetical protein
MHHTLLALATAFSLLALIAWRGWGESAWSIVWMLPALVAVVFILGMIIWAASMFLSIVVWWYLLRRDKRRGIWDDEASLEQVAHPIIWKEPPDPLSGLGHRNETC